MSLGEPNVKRALGWILDRLADDPGAKRGELIDEASRRFDLTPLEADFLYRQLSEALKGKPPGQARP
ncbi:MAG: hypothetical protein ACRELA_22475 [Candidatus Rokuibacteriota bacterium]